MKSARSLPGALLVAFLVAPILAGCGGGSLDSASTAQEPAQPQRGAPAAGARDGAGEAAGDGENAAGAPGRLTEQAKPGRPAEQVKLNPAGARAVVYTATLRVRAPNVDRASAQAKQLVTAAGGYVQSESAAAADSADLTFKIPSDRYTATLDQLAGRLGTRMSLTQQAEDVTEEVADVESRVRSAEAALDSFRKLLDRANTVGEVINVEQEIARRQAELESLQARQKSLAHQTGYATVTLELRGPDKGEGAGGDDERGGFLGGLERGWNGLVAIGSGLAVATGTLLPFLAVAAAIGLVVLGVRRLVRARRATG
ncbi:DUF4349 domain-containing protein [Thermomonospora echinospora]|uniref:DUF4349 domain-containing protein n=1 Tax=Thermomonospora echinospora TaxID=1992 RepID=UPI0013587A64|nr:DUF4349 domain-containing protein [Thermomonospora echinospora]